MSFKMTQRLSENNFFILYLPFLNIPSILSFSIIHSRHIKIHYNSDPATQKLISLRAGIYCYKPLLFLLAFTFEPKYKHI